MSQAYPTSPIPAVGAVVFKNRAVLLVRRSQPPNRGLWAIPGGCIRLGETFQAAAEREIWEETGIRIRARHPVYIFDTIDRDDQDRIRYHYVITDVLADYVEGWPTAGDDALEARWVTPEEFDTLPVSETTVDLLRGGGSQPGFPSGWRIEKTTTTP
uniref:ADP-ribose pyrophosphatase YjhB, NUDIX family n=1 Tax=Candidatus Kentrum eta TaxID=2126337 RepID=A0A450UNK2_9GAMM|nr:MAG: ADP-ribose pyrophosphatase YjhB, NUDIX family [Candidatus Kentron sp. H]VFJ94106.1 MAG: ADP-ribose pyrophosphatase YjhB, NUDIX family [Candidatus Kentron sp. H]VFK02269.1 MAG: ADP-ribose pyrophosphatase YjhB, NUDIX family [Candidatus Kentron sp. H]